MAQASKMALNPRLFWFAPAGTTIDLSEPAMQDFYVQHVLTHGRAGDIRALLSRVQRPQLQQTLQRIARFLRPDIRAFWTEFLGYHY